MITVEIITPEKLLHTTKGVEVLLPTITGELGIRTNHIPLIAILKAGAIVVKQKDGGEEVFAVAGGFVEITNNTIHVLADTAERAEDLHEERIKEAIERAKEMKEEHPQSRQAFAVALPEANIARLKAIQRKKAHHHLPRIES